MTTPVITYGLELEFAAVGSRIRIVNDLASQNVPIVYSHTDLKPDFTRNWYLGTDGSVTQKPLHGYELRSRMFQEFPTEELSAILRYLKSHNCRTTPTAGLHFHFSGGNVNVEELTKAITKLRITKKTRQKFCLQRHVNKKYVPIHHIAYCHYECRVFNASLKFRAIYQNWLTLRKLLGTVGVSPTAKLCEYQSDAIVRAMRILSS
jgi:hypothetical protein